MSEASSPVSETSTRGRGRGRGRGNRGGLGKYLRARGRGRGRGRPAEFGQRLLLEGEVDEEEDEEEATERAAKYSRRQLGTNADRYVEPEPELGSDGEPEVEPEVDLSSFLEKQRISDDSSPSIIPTDRIDEDDVDNTLAHIGSRTQASGPTKKGRVEEIEWDQELDELSQDKAAAEATWELKSRFRAKSERLRAKPVAERERKGAASYTEAPALPSPHGSLPQHKNPKDEMQDFLDDLLG
ncbi:hypothetical protein D9615_007180 [Tricholomella constricta]|uniref:Uncharacterized protein n=1 Tax=Tricholomella constricta TaxID=117010 RepID=A0A8H5H8D0_9AGAR|nr:hypothetical protein D9615_007180 [Tricholomella constricta]